MKAAVLRAYKTPLEIEDISIVKPQGREVLVRVAACGVCHSELHVIDGFMPLPLPLVLGHECAGVVEQVGPDVRNIAPGDHVVMSVPTYCGLCEDCLSGHLTRCRGELVELMTTPPKRLSQDGKGIYQFVGLGGFAEQILVKDTACVSIPKEMPLDRAAVMGCAVVTGLGAVMHVAKVEPGETVAIIGCGGIGLCAVNGALIAGAGRIIAIDLVPHKLALAKTFGATDVVNPKDGDPLIQVRELTGGKGVHKAIECIGLKSTAEQAFAILRPGGRAAIMGVFPPGTKLEIDTSALMGERSLLGSTMGSGRFPIDIPRYVQYYLQGRLNLDELISERIPLSQVNQAVEALRTGNVARQVIVN